MTRNMKIMLAVLGALVVVALGEYTVGGGLHTIKWEFKRRQMMKEARLHQGEPFLLPFPAGPRDARLKVTVFVDSHNGCHAGKVDAMAKVLKPFTDRVHVAFRDSHTPGAERDLAGYAVGCSMTTMINGLIAIKVPWVKKPLGLQGPMGENLRPMDYKKLLDWAVSPEGLKSLEEQRKALEPERQKRIKIEAARKKAAPAPAAAATGSAPAGEPPAPGQR
jgi:hypothetical protein